MIIEETILFLSKIPPFQFLDEKALGRLAASSTMEFYPKGGTILHQEGPPSEYLRVIKKGGVKVFVKSDKGEEVLIDYRSEGDAFGFLSLVGGDKSRATVVAVEDTICLLIKKEAVLKLLDSHPTFTEYFLKSFLNKYIDKAYQEMRTKSSLYGPGDKMLFTTPVGELATKEVVTAPQDLSVREAAQMMSKYGISSLVIVEDEGSPVGIITDRDLRDKVVARGKDVGSPVSNIMSVALIKAEARDYCFDALLKMIRFNIHHLLVVDGGRLKGVITNHDLMMLQGTSPISIAREIESQSSVEGLVPVSQKISGMVKLLLKEGAKASNITRIITEINDRLVRKIMEIVESKVGRPPVPYCWIVYGSEGRKEQTFKTDQDNAIIYADPVTDEEKRRAEQYFADFAEYAGNALVSCGFPACTGGYMASNPKWRQPLGNWKAYFTDWITTPTPEAILLSVILFDYRPVYGDVRLAEDLREHLLAVLKGQDMFLAFMANMTVSLRPPLGFFKTFVVEKSGEHKDKLNLKFRCLAPLIDIVRLYSLEARIGETSTLERIDALREIHGVVAEYEDELEHAFEFISLLRIHHQFDRMEAGLAPDNFIDPNNLGNLEKRMLKESCQLISRIQDAIAKQYRPGTVM
jgi:CBS domain-containing protein